MRVRGEGPLNVAHMLIVARKKINNCHLSSQHTRITELQ